LVSYLAHWQMEKHAGRQMPVEESQAAMEAR